MPPDVVSYPQEPAPAGADDCEGPLEEVSP